MSATTFTFNAEPFTSTSTDNNLTSASYGNREQYLTGVVIGTSCTSVGTECFRFCSNLTSVSISTTVTSLGDYSFDNSGITSITIPDNVLSLGISCFDSCSYLTSVTLSNSLTLLPETCFSGVAITEITIPDSVTSLEINCFTNCALNTIYIPQNVTNIGYQCFLFCQSLTSVIYENPSIITSVGSQVYSFTPQMNVKFYNTPTPPIPESGVYNTSIYTSGSTFEYFSGASCYNEGTLILCLKDNIEQYIKIEDLKKDDLVKTYLHGYKKIKLIGKNQMINNPTNDLKCMYQYNDLICTGGHSILVDELTNEEKEKMNKYNFSEIIDDKKLLLSCSSDKFKKITNKKEYTIYHMVLEGDNKQYGIYVNNEILSETTDEKNFLKNNFMQL